MILIDIPTYTSDHTYVVKLHRDANPRLGFLKGRLEHVPSGDRMFFATGEELVAAMSRMASSIENELFPENQQGTQR